MFNRLRQLRKRGRGEEGSVAVELGILLPVLLLLIVGGIDLGHCYYIKHIITNASREGARYAAKYTYPSQPATTGTVSNYVKLASGLDYNSFNLSNLVVTTSPSPVVPGSVATVTVTAVKHWWILSTFNFYGGLGLTDPQTLTAATAMIVEGP
jgi:Flp pilus assembly protein TadG